MKQPLEGKFHPITLTSVSRFTPHPPPATPHPSSAPFLQVALHRARGDYPAAAAALRSYLEVYSGDRAAWEELAETCLRMQLYQQAAFCMEEALLLAPGNPAAMLLLADTLYTLGGQQNFRSARGYYAGVVEATGGGSVRALLGVCACAAQLAGKSKGSSGGGSAGQRGGREDDDAGLPAAAAAATLERYAAVCPDKVPLVREMLKAQGVL
jgi:ER membrane protein complex subunit 2